MRFEKMLRYELIKSLSYCKKSPLNPKRPIIEGDFYVYTRFTFIFSAAYSKSSNCFMSTE